jgi:hypothetical protein
VGDAISIFIRPVGPKTPGLRSVFLMMLARPVDDGYRADGDEYSGDILKFKAAKRSTGKAGDDPTA